MGRGRTTPENRTAQPANRRKEESETRVTTINSETRNALGEAGRCPAPRGGLRPLDPDQGLRPWTPGSQAITCPPNRGSSKQYARVYLELGQTERMLGEWDSALTHACQALLLCEGGDLHYLKGVVH